MQRRQFLSGLGTSLLLPVFAKTGYAQSGYPAKPVTIISDAAAGSAPDVAVRLVADGLTKVWGQQVIVLNRPGANGSIAARAASEVQPDGYTLFMPSLSTFVALPTVAPNLPVKLPKDFLPIGFAADQPMFITMSPSVPANTLPEFIALAKKEPGKYTVAVSGVGRLTHLTSELLQARAGIQLVSVPYTHGMANAMADAASGRVSLIVENFSAVIGGVKGGQIKLLAVASAKRLPDFPDVPTVAETLPGFIASGWQALLAPVGTPAPLIEKISADMRKVVTDPEFAKKMAPLGGYPRAMNPQETQAFVAQQQETWLPIVEKITQKQ
jgi:tripartite-type tricarboxylate transporter receptor subunit TctC